MSCGPGHVGHEVAELDLLCVDEVVPEVEAGLSTALEVHPEQKT